VVGDANVLVTVGEAGLRHCFQCIGAVRGGAVGVQNAKEVRGRDERWDLVRRGALDLIQAFAQLRFDVLQPERFVDLGFVSRRDDLAPTTQPLGFVPQ